MLNVQRWPPLLLCALLCASGGCEDDGGDWRDPGPDEVLERFLTHWYLEEHQELLSLIAPQDRAQLEAAHERLRAMKVPDSVGPRPEEMLELGWVANPYLLRKTQVVDRLKAPPAAGQRVAVKVVQGDGEEAVATMVWSGERWYVDLPLEAAHGEESEGS